VTTTTTGISGDIDEASTALVQRRTVRVLSTSQLLGGVAVAGSVPAGALLADAIADSDAAAGLAQTSVVTGAAIVALPLARLALTRGRRASLVVGYGVGALGAAVVVVGASASSLALLLVGSLLLGSSQAAGFGARYAATDLATEEHRGRALSWVVWAATIGAVAGPNLLDPSGTLSERWGLPPLAGPYLVAVAALGIAAVVLFVRLRPDPYLLATRMAAKAHTAVSAATGTAGAVVAPPAARVRDGIAHLRGEPVAVLGIATVAVGHLVMVMVMVMTPVHMAHVDVTVSLIGLVISVHIVGMYAFSPVVGWAVDRTGARTVASVGMAILVVACVVSGLTHAGNVVVLGTGLLLLGLGWSCTLIAGSTMVVEAVGARERPAVQGLSDLVMNGAGALGGALAGVIVLLTSYTVLALGAVVPVAALFLWTQRVRPANT
jgi:MFS family permease